MTEGTIGGRVVRVTGEVSSCGWLLLEPMDADDRGMEEQETELLRRLCPGRAFALAGFTVDWQEDLTPWPGKAVFKGQPDFGNGAARTLGYVTDTLLPALTAQRTNVPRVILGGYSLAGLFALWAGYQTDRFDGIAAASPSVWYPGWTDYAAGHPFRARAAYLSLGDREAKTRNALMSTVDGAIRAQHAALAAQAIPAVLEWNAGNHFMDAALRTAKGFAWCMERNAALTEGGSFDAE